MKNTQLKNMKAPLKFLVKYLQVQVCQEKELQVVISEGDECLFHQAEGEG